MKISVEAAVEASEATLELAPPVTVPQVEDCGELMGARAASRSPPRCFSTPHIRTRPEEACKQYLGEAPITLSWQAPRGEAPDTICGKRHIAHVVWRWAEHAPPPSPPPPHPAQPPSLTSRPHRRRPYGRRARAAAEPKLAVALTVADALTTSILAAAAECTAVESSPPFSPLPPSPRRLRRRHPCRRHPCRHRPRLGAAKT
jgi:hypothetical protein